METELNITVDKFEDDFNSVLKFQHFCNEIMSRLFLVPFILPILISDTEFVTRKFERLFSDKKRYTEKVSTFEGVSFQYCSIISSTYDLFNGFNFAPSTGSCDVFQENTTAMQCFSSESHYDYYSLAHLNPCQPNPCKYNIKCQVVFSSNNCGIDFECKCPLPTGGKTCQEIVCDTFCTRSGPIFYYFYYNSTRTWLDSFKYCKSKEMDMIMVKNETTWTTVKNKLFADLPRNQDKPKHYWLGLNRSSDSAPWMWVDNTPLNFSSWYPSQPDDNMCGMMPWHLNYSWADEPCNVSQYYSSACQKYYSFFEN